MANAQTAYNNAQAEVTRANEAVNTAQVNVNTANSNLQKANSELANLQAALPAEKAAAQQKVNDAQTKLDNANQALTTAKNNVTAKQSEIAKAEEALKTAQANSKKYTDLLAQRENAVKNANDKKNAADSAKAASDKADQAVKDKKAEIAKLEEDVKKAQQETGTKQEDLKDANAALGKAFLESHIKNQGLNFDSYLNQLKKVDVSQLDAIKYGGYDDSQIAEIQKYFDSTSASEMRNLAAKAEKSQINEGKTIDLPCGLDYEKMDQLADYKMIQDDLNSKSSNIMRDINEACKVENLEKAANLITSVNKLRGQETDLNDENLKGLNISYDLTIRTIVESAIERTAKSVPNWKQGNADYLLL